MSNGNHDTLVYRLSQMLVKLNQGEKLEPQELAEEFGVNLRTIQRDLNERFAYLPLEKTNGRYHIDQTFLGKLSTRDIERFASLAGVRGLFPSLSDEFLRDIFDNRIQSTLLIKGHNYEDLAGKEPLFKQLEQAIVGRHHVSFDYQKEDGLKHYPMVAPYKLVNHKGIWYLAGVDGEKLKAYSFSKIAHVRQLDSHYEADAVIDQRLQDDDGIWYGDATKEVVLKISSQVAGYFKRRKLIANQIIEKELEDGVLIVSARIGHPNQVFPIVRYWIPHVRIISPEEWQRSLETTLDGYLNKGS